MEGINNAGRHTLKGTIRIFSSELLILPTGILTVSFLTHRLGPHEFGLFILTSTIVTWIEWSINAIFGRANIKLVGEATDWRPISAATTRLHLLFSLLIMFALMMLAEAIASALNEQMLARYIRFMSLDIPLFAFAQCYRQVLVATGDFSHRAYLSAGRWISRLVWIVLFVELGLSVQGAILGCIGASCVEIIIGHQFIDLPIFMRSHFDSKKFWKYVAPLSLAGLSMRTFDKLDIFMLKLLGGTAVAAGFYGAAQNVSILPGIFTLSFSPLLLSTLTRLMKTGDEETAKDLISDSIRFTLFMLPFGAMVAGSSAEIVRFLFGKIYLPAAPVLTLLIFSALSVSVTSIATAILTASGKPSWTLFIVGPFVPAALLGHFIFIPRLGSLGAALVTTILAILAAVISISVVYGIWHTLPRVSTFLRTFVIGMGAWIAASFWPASGSYLILKLTLLGILIIVSYFLLGEFTRKEIEIARAFILNRRRMERGV